MADDWKLTRVHSATNLCATTAGLSTKQGAKGERRGMKAKAKHPDRFKGMNKTEQAYAWRLMASKRIASWIFEGLKFRLAKKTFYTPDFVIITTDGLIELHEVKGFWRDDARVKIKVAAEMFPWFDWVAVTTVKGVWEYERFN